MKLRFSGIQIADLRLTTAGLADGQCSSANELLPVTSQRPVTLRLSRARDAFRRSISIAGDGPFSIPQRFESDRTPSGVEDRLAKDSSDEQRFLSFRIYDLPIHVGHSPQCGLRSRRVADTAASPGGTWARRRRLQLCQNCANRFH